MAPFRKEREVIAQGVDALRDSSNLLMAVAGTAIVIAVIALVVAVVK